MIPGRVGAPEVTPRLLALLLTALLVTALNLGVRLDREMVDVWDESLFAAHALDMHQSRQWVVTTTGGEVDYYDTKPPLNSWLVATSFDLFGVGLVPLRLPSVLAAAGTVLTVFIWARSVLGMAVAAWSVLVLSTSYPFLFVHSGRTANADAPLALLVTLMFVVLWRSSTTPRQLAGVGPLVAAAIMLKGPAALGFMAPLVVAGAVAQMRHRRPRSAWVTPLAVGGVAGVLPVALWALARWQFDGWRFLGPMVDYDIVQRATTAIQGHDETWHFYVDVLLRHHYDWLVLTGAAVLLAPKALRQAWQRVSNAHPDGALLIGAWAVATWLVPTLLPTKLAWYLTPFYPGAAVVTALAVHDGWRQMRDERQHRRAAAFAALVVLAVGVAEGRMIYRSVARIDLHRSPQGLLLAFGDAVRGARVFAAGCPSPEAFLIDAAGGTCVAVANVDDAGLQARPGDLWVDTAPAVAPGFTLLGRNREASLHRRPGEAPTSR